MVRSEKKEQTAVVVVQARMGSSRLPGKMMADLVGKPLLWHILKRASCIRKSLPVILATTDHERDDVLVTVAQGLGVEVVRGSEENVFSRFQLALSLVPARWVVRICGDSPLFDPQFLDHCLQAAEDNEADVVKFKDNPPSLFQGGEVVSASALQFSADQAKNDPLVFEHVTAWSMRNAEQFPDDLKTVYIQPAEEMMHEIKLSIDTDAELQRLRTLYQALYDGQGILDLKTAARWIHDGGWN